MMLPGERARFATETPRAGGWPSTTSRQRRVRRAGGQGECGENVTAPRGHDKALRWLVKEPKERLHPDPTVPLSQAEHHSIPRPRIPCCSYTTVESVEYQRHDAKS